MITGFNNLYVYVDNINKSKLEVTRELLSLINIITITDGREYSFKVRELTYDEGSFLASITYELYLLDYKECKLNEYLTPNYFEQLYFDMDREFVIDEIHYFDNMAFQKKDYGWLRIE